MKRVRASLRRNLLSLAVLLFVPVAGLLAALWLARGALREQVGLLVDEQALLVVIALSGVALLLWWLALGSVQGRTRPREVSRWKVGVSRTAASLTALAMAVPLVYVGWTAWVTRQAIMQVAPDAKSATAPDRAEDGEDWGGDERFTIALLGGDGGVGRTGIRTDSVIVLSVDIKTGRTVTFSLPRNLRDVPFPADSPLAEVYPDGFVSADGEAGNSMLNAIYPIVPQEHPGILGESDNEGADAIKQGLSGALGFPVDYYVLVNLRGFEQIVDAIGGITVNINKPIPIEGNTDLGIPPTGYLDPGPAQRLDGFDALWYARGRWGLSDYDRMERQRCALAAIVDEADPGNLLLRYTSLANEARKILRTDIPRDLLPDVAKLALRMKDEPLRSVVFQISDDFDPNEPDYDYLQSVVRRALDPPQRPTPSQAPSTTPSPSEEPSPSADPSPTDEPEPADQATQTTADACAYDPVEAAASSTEAP
ncbi:hypothetical protein GCM10027425_04040 [Alteromonas gracilis]